MKFHTILLVVLLEPMLSQAFALPDSSAQKFDIAKLGDDYDIHENLDDSPFSDERSPNDNPLTLEKKDTEADIAVLMDVTALGLYECVPVIRSGRSCTCP
ncbi:hypothetical protein N7478_010213 [Penicillium angulare]|uniref:uncharacterized protein n=1 Tax=Penicillium angulare TaxID=116970 RepID=UPI00253F8EB1|nr:uncharacterized protein N7478_010213 [Penicillium angulare]KAJ5267405.1 hypothetical protein N7478_010213 [Penicillium angulare]